MRGKGFFMVGSAGLALGGLLHLSSQLGHGDIPLTRAAVEAAMRAYKIEMMGMTFSLKDVMDAWGISFGVLAIFGGAQNLVTVSLLPRSAGLGVLSATSALASAVLLGVAISYHIAPPIVVFSSVFACFAAATFLELRQGTGASGA